MKPWTWDKQLGLALPLNCAAIQNVQTNTPPKNEMGLDASHHIHLSLEGTGESFFLDILFHRISEMAMFRQQLRVGREPVFAAGYPSCSSDVFVWKDSLGK